MNAVCFVFSFSPTSPPVVDFRTIMETEESRQKYGAVPKLNLGLVKKKKKEIKRKDRVYFYFCPSELEQHTASFVLFLYN